MIALRDIALQSLNGEHSSAPSVLYQYAGPTTIATPPTISDTSGGVNIKDFKETGINITNYDSNTYWANQVQKYDYAMSKSADELKAEGIVVTLDNGSIFKNNKAWLPIQDIQKIENERGTPGALLIHMREPSIAKETAGYEGGSSATTGGTQVTTPIPEVQTITSVTEATSGTSAPIADAMEKLSGTKHWWLWYLFAFIIIVLIIKFKN